MGGIPDVMFVIDANKEELAIKEANTLGIPVVAILDSNVSPDGIAFPVPANDDASRAIRLYCEAIAIAATRGGQERRRAAASISARWTTPPAEEALTSTGRSSRRPSRHAQPASRHRLPKLPADEALRERASSRALRPPSSAGSRAAPSRHRRGTAHVACPAAFIFNQRNDEQWRRSRPLP